MGRSAGRGSVEGTSGRCVEGLGASVALRSDLGGGTGNLAAHVRRPLRPPGADLDRLRGKGRICEADLDEALGEIRTALLEADVELSVTRRFCDGIRLRVSAEALSKSLTPGQQVIKAVHEELVGVLGGESLKITYASRPPTVVLMAGLQGSGKTTASAKLARWWKQQGRNPLLVGADLQRPAAVEQLRVLGEPGRCDRLQRAHRPGAAGQGRAEEARRLGQDVCIIDTAGRLTIDADLMERDPADLGAPPSRTTRSWSSTP